MDLDLHMTGVNFIHMCACQPLLNTRYVPSTLHTQKVLLRKPSLTTILSPCIPYPPQPIFFAIALITFYHDIYLFYVYLKKQSLNKLFDLKLTDIYKVGIIISI